ncbi:MULTISPECIES: diaminopropionate ammonia-lyase [unclassified Streptomyces]|uniref:diaminopropionate ammonia-lyase n=1 Tax=unclassified Streptomyces TaxID=2593676 RepID=UPI002E32F202|nr:diaminopropionate ammonia-lyase [Streptomyces sp. NBC_01361]
MTHSSHTPLPWIARPRAAHWNCPAPPDDVPAFHRSVPGYEPTPLVEVPGLAVEWGVRRVVVKDESARLGLPAFKALGVFYAVYQVVRDRVGPRLAPTDFASLQATVPRMERLTLVTATDGNHGRALAHIARRLGLPCRVFVPDVVETSQIDAIRDEGAHVVVLPENYDRTVEIAAKDAAEPGAVLVQDTAWPGYESIPQYIVNGYSTMFSEIDDQLGPDKPSLVVTPMGVGSLAQAVVTHAKSRPHRVAVLGAEPDTAGCVLASLQAGEPVTVATGKTAMAGLNCGTPSHLAWPYLRQGLDASALVTDGQALAAAEPLHAAGVSAGPCGAATVPAVRTVLDSVGGREALGLDETSVVVLLSTERHRSSAAA